MIEQLLYYLSYPFVQYALIVSILIAICSSLLGVTLVLKRFSFIGDSLSHIAFMGMIIGTLLKVFNTNAFVMVITIASAIFLLKSNNNIVKNDSLLAMLSVGTLAIGYLLLNTFSTSSNIAGDVCTVLFGSTSILTLSKEDVILCIVMSVLVFVFYILFYNKIFAITFDETFSKATGLKTKLYNLILSTIIAIVIVLSMNLVGSLLITALIIFPALSAMRVFNSFKKVVCYSAILSTICSTSGIIISILLSTPIGSTIVAANIVIYILHFIAGKILKR